MFFSLSIYSQKHDNSDRRIIILLLVLATDLRTRVQCLQLKVTHMHIDAHRPRSSQNLPINL